MKNVRHAWRYPSTSKDCDPSALSCRNLVRFTDDKLHAVSSKNMYSEHGFDALIFPLFGQVCHLLIVESYWTPGSAHDQAASATIVHKSFASSVSQTSPVVRMIVCHLPPARTAFMKSSVT